MNPTIKGANTKTINTSRNTMKKALEYSMDSKIDIPKIIRVNDIKNEPECFSLESVGTGSNHIGH